MIKKALEFAENAHKNQFRKDGVTPYFQHCLDVYNLLKECDLKNELEEHVYIVALLHDTIEDTSVTYEDLVNNFNSFVVEDVKALTFIKDENNIFAKAGYLAIISLDPIVNAIKVADRICNVKDFVKTNNCKYAKKYFHQADICFHALYHSKDKNIFYNNLWNKVIELNESLKRSS